MKPQRAIALSLVNGLTFFRLGLAFTFPLITPTARLPIVAIAALSDFADGVIARRYDGASWIGGLLDAIADKLFVFAVLYVVARDGGLEPWQIGLLLSRDIAVAVASAYAVVKRRWEAFQIMASRAWGKRTTAALFALFVLILAGPGEAGGIEWIWAERIAFWIAAAFSMLAGIDYARKFLKTRREFRSGGLDVIGNGGEGPVG